MDARTIGWHDQENARITTIVRQKGWFIRYVLGGDCGCDERPEGSAPSPPFAYTVGFFGLRHPELLVFGLPPEDTAALFNDLGARIRDGEDLIPGQMITFEDWTHRVVPEVVPNPGDIVFDANGFYGKPDHDSVTVLQLSYDDLEGRFPWDDGYAAPEMQPRPGAFTA